MLRMVIAAALLAGLYGCTGSSEAATPPTTTPTTTPASPATQPATAPAGSPVQATATPRFSPQAGLLGTYQAARRTVVLTEPAHAGPAGHVGRRVLRTDIWYPQVQQAGTQYPLIVFAPGYEECTGAYTPLLKAWASAGFVVAAVNFPGTNCKIHGANENDIVNQPADMSYVVTALLGAASGDVPVPVSRQEIAAAGQSDGGDTVVALAASRCCTDHRFAAIAVFSGQDYPNYQSMHFTGRGAPPMLFTQGTADPVNAPSSSLWLYRIDRNPARHYLSLHGAAHLDPYVQYGRAEQAVARVSVAFFGHYLLGLPGTLATMNRAGNAPGATLVSGGRLP